MSYVLGADSARVHAEFEQGRKELNKRSTFDLWRAKIVLICTLFHLS